MKRPTQIEISHDLINNIYEGELTGFSIQPQRLMNDDGDWFEAEVTMDTAEWFNVLVSIGTKDHVLLARCPSIIDARTMCFILDSIIILHKKTIISKIL